MFVSKVYAAAPTLDQMPNLIVNIFGLLFPFAGVALFLMFLYGGIMWLMSTGDPQKIQKAQGTLLWAVVGTIILVCAVVIINTVERFLGLPAGTLTTINF
ncbi:hypothetical protein JW887_06615 [Candidatus Dojkabacteria bacterium]|nr:hypothetical protein [Candidatus Dojkabacteria bacterium]